MIEVAEWLKDEESFRARLAAAAKRLDCLAEKRRSFLRAALDDLAPLIERAERLGDLPLLVELRTIHEAAYRELEPQNAPPSAPEPPVLVEIAREPDAEEANTQLDLLPEPHVGESPATQVDADSAGPTQSEVCGETAPGVDEEPPAKPVRKRTKWVPRAPSETNADLKAIEQALERGLPEGGAGLVALKALACKLRLAWAEQQDRAEPQEVTRGLNRTLSELARQKYDGPYVIALDATFQPESPQDWEALSSAYRALGPAIEAYEWFARWETELTDREAVTLLESTGAAQQRLYRMLARHFAAKRDEQQAQLFDGIRSSREKLGIYLSALHPDTSDAELIRLANRMEAEYRSLRATVERRQAQSLALGDLQGILAAEDFGDREGDEKVLQQACLRCLQAGVPATKPEFRNSLLDWGCFLESVKGLEKLSAEIEKERDRQERKLKPSATAEEIDEAALSPEIERLRLELVPFTRGKTCLFVGGHPSEAHRNRIIDALELKDLLWPESDRFDARAADLEGDLRHSDLVALLVRFMRKGMKNVKGPCKAEGKPVIHLARGLNVSRVITSFHSQLVHAA